MNNPAPLTHKQETEAGQQRRIDLEVEGVAQARAELDAGLGIDEADVDAWIDSLDTGHPLPPPAPRR